MSANGEGRRNFLKWLNERRASKLSETAGKYAKLPENIRAAISRVAGVKNERLDVLSAADRKKLRGAAKELTDKTAAAYVLLVVADTTQE